MTVSASGRVDRTVEMTAAGWHGDSSVPHSLLEFARLRPRAPSLLLRARRSERDTPAAFTRRGPRPLVDSASNSASSGRRVMLAKGDESQLQRCDELGVRERHPCLLGRRRSRSRTVATSYPSPSQESSPNSSGVTARSLPSVADPQLRVPATWCACLTPARCAGGSFHRAATDPFLDTPDTSLSGLSCLRPILGSMHPGYCPQCGERVTPYAAGCALCGADLDPKRWQKPASVRQRLSLRMPAALRRAVRRERAVRTQVRGRRPLL
jgi:hypothetical protein